MELQGKRSASDHINEAVNHINHMKDKIQHLTLEKDKLESSSNYSTSTQIPSPKSESNLENSSLNSVVISPSFGGMEILINGGFREEDLSLSRVLKVLVVEEGLNVVRCASTKVNGRSIHTIKVEVYMDQFKYFITLSFVYFNKFFHQNARGFYHICFTG